MHCSPEVFPAHAGVFPFTATALPAPFGVFPAHAGVFPSGIPGVDQGSGLPRARGGVPKAALLAHIKAKSSPRTRGCSHVTSLEMSLLAVFPAHAGVFPPGRVLRNRSVSLPRARGGVPVGWLNEDGITESSPRTRGCSRKMGRKIGAILVFPAHAGVFPSPLVTASASLRLPRARGGVPHFGGGCPPGLESSPRTRGCSHRGSSRRSFHYVFPAHAGVFGGSTE